MKTVVTQEDATAIDWYRGLTPVEKRTFWTCFGGWALDAMDADIFIRDPRNHHGLCDHQYGCRLDRNSDVTHFRIWRLVRGRIG
jgi:hypothetical protein